MEELQRGEAQVQEKTVRKRIAALTMKDNHRDDGKRLKRGTANNEYRLEDLL